MYQKVLERPAQGSIKIKTSGGTITVHDARMENVHTSDNTYQPYFAHVIAGRKVTFRRNLRSWWQGAVRRAERRESISHPTRGVTRTRYWRWGVMGAETTVQFDSRGQDIIWSLEIDVPALSFEVSVRRWYFRPGHVELKLPDVHLSIEGINRRLDVSPLSLWSYPWGDEREWGISILRLNGASLFLWANPQEDEGRPRLDVLWRHIHPRQPKK